MQRGHIYKSHGSWFLLYRENGKQVTKRLGSCDEYITQRSVEPLAQDVIRGVNRSADPGMTLEDFIRTTYLPHCLETLRASTAHGYQNLFRSHVIGREEARLKMREYSTRDVQRLLDSVAAEKELTSNTLQHTKHFLSGAFRYAAQCGVREGNPVREARVPRRHKKSAETYAYSLHDIHRTLEVLPLHLKAAVAVAAFAGLRLSEIHGLEWTDVSADSITIRQNVWRGHVNAPKSKASADYVPMINVLKEILDEHRAVTKDPRVFPYDLEHFGNRKVKPAMKQIGLQWHGWQAFRRGVASNLYALNCDDLIVQRVLRHSKVIVTREHYIKHRDPKLQAAMERMNEAFSATKMKTVQ